MFGGSAYALLDRINEDEENRLKRAKGTPILDSPEQEYTPRKGFFAILVNIIQVLLALGTIIGLLILVGGR